MGAARASAPDCGFAIAATRNLAPQDFALAYESRRELRRTAVFAAGTTQDQRVSAIFYDSLSVIPVDSGDLRNRLETQDAASPKFSKPGQSVFQSRDGPQGVEFVNDEPQPLITLHRGVHSFEDG